MADNLEHKPAGRILIGAALATALAIALGGLWYQSSQVASVRQELVETQKKMDQLHGQFETSVSVAKTEVNETIAKMNEQVEKSRRDALASANHARTSARQGEVKVLATLDKKNQELTQQIDELKNDSNQKSTQVDQTLNGIKGDVGDVKTEVATTRNELAQTTTELKRMTGDMGVMSGLIATNSTELGALRKLGEKDYYEFTLPKTSKPQRVGDIQLALKKSDAKRNKFTLDVLADDKRVEKKDKNLNEPVQFYTAGARIPYEIVVNEIRKDQVIGYLAVPKVKVMAKR